MNDGFTRIEAKDLSYSNSFPSPKRHFIIRWVENLTGRITILKLAKKHQQEPPLPGNFWQQAMTRMEINTDIGEEALAKTPKTGPLIIVANHPHGLVDGMVLCEIMSRVRPDFKIMTRAFLAKVPDINDRMLPVAFDHEEDAIRKNVQARKDALNHVKGGGCLILFPAGRVAHSDTFFGDAIDGEWTNFLARLIARGKAGVVPMFFRGQNSRAYLIAAKLSPTFRQGLLMHEVARSLKTDMRPVVGDAISFEELEALGLPPKEMAAYLRNRTLKLGDS
ncbi:MAG: lysophospholipid acyltransferase family protein [Rhodobacteraceae bacterium]|nr:lysophospholipid acyltransferase family protein [Paracoccaceae bacterium]